jgi:hypothetical protein
VFLAKVFRDASIVKIFRLRPLSRESALIAELNEIRTALVFKERWREFFITPGDEKAVPLPFARTCANGAKNREIWRGQNR